MISPNQNLKTLKPFRVAALQALLGSSFLALVLVVGASCLGDGDKAYSRPRVEISTANTSGLAPLSVEFVSIVSGGIGSRTYSWDFGDGTTSSAANPTHTFVDVGTYVVVLRVKDEEGTEGASGIHIVVTGPQNLPPLVVATIAEGECAIPGRTIVQLDASTTTDPENDPLSYAWSFVSIPIGSSPRLNDTTVINPSFAASVEGIYELRVVVSDGANVVESEILRVTSSGASQLSVVSGSAQGGTVNEGVTNDLVVSVSNSCGLAVDNAAVNWRGANATMLFGVSSSTIDGSALNRVTLGSVAGSATVLASLISDDSVRVTFNLTATAGPAARLLMNLDASTRIVSTAPQAVRFHVTDSFGNPTTSPDVTFDLILDTPVSQSSVALFDDCTTGSKSKQGVATSGGIATVNFCSTTAEDVYVEIFNISSKLEPGGSVQILFDDMEANDVDYTQVQRGPLLDENYWEHGMPTQPIALSPYSGVRVRGTVLDADVRQSPFDNNPLRSVLTHPLDLRPSGPGAIISARLSFQQFVDIGEAANFDCRSHVTLHMGSPDFGATRPYNTFYDTSGCFGEGFFRTSPDWQEVNFDLSPHIGTTTSLNWSLVASASAVGSGWYIDDVSVTGLVTVPVLRFVAGPSETVALTKILDGASESCQPGIVHGQLSDGAGNLTSDDGIEVTLSSDSSTTTFTNATHGQNFVGGAVATIESVGGEFSVALNNTVVGAETVSVRGQVSGELTTSDLVIEFQGLSTEDAFATGCSDGVDSDCDGDIDCDDSDCAGNPVCDCIAPYFDKGGRCARTYFMTSANWIGAQSECGGGQHFHSCDSTPYGFRFDDIPQPDSTIITAIDIETFSGVDCSGPASRELTVNNTLGAIFIYNGDSCSCNPTPNLQTLPSINAAGLSAYTLGGTNDLEIANPLSCEGFSQNPAFGGDGLWAVTVTY